MREAGHAHGTPSDTRPQNRSSRGQGSTIWPSIIKTKGTGGKDGKRTKNPIPSPYFYFDGIGLSIWLDHLDIVWSGGNFTLVVIHVPSLNSIGWMVGEIITVFLNCEIYRSLSPRNRKWRHWGLLACKNYCVTMHLQSFSLTEEALCEIFVFLYLMSNWPCELDFWSRSLFNWSWCDIILGQTNLIL